VGEGQPGPVLKPILTAALDNEESVALLAAYAAISQPSARRILVEMTEALAGAEDQGRWVCLGRREHQS